ncbi:cobyrinate a,c-diamide synthase [Siphonobacter sp. SORGH_AS_1065]|uniref:cobyrinate a,c-diamide synthase n=1 Tax=Siphonobacter sp. SORGH_AS_1065 TaxID=3041795 RepID=UPI00278520F0|nr:cobyrinate a,c-diamide synthase [Siphonobacter sp. SORGH_AS_1065]MDQ1090321.1 cobyrinic acid a,c-diamide synthase [Siphonobacter sp. SORGH_AS_1065]
MNVTHFMIAAPSSGSGKTTLTLGLLRVLRQRGYRVQPFKCGPDYIDSRHHATAAGKTSLNLDTFLSSEAHVKELYTRYASPSDIAVSEAVMGLFDGSDRMQNSSAHLATLLNIPIILVVNAKAMAYSAAPLLYGYKHFKPEIQIAGVIFNNVNTPTHYQFLKEASEDVGIEVLGYLPSNPDFEIPSRHLGLHISSETDYEAIIQRIADALPQTVQVDRLLELCNREISTLQRSSGRPFKHFRMAVAQDEAFSFYYPANLEALKPWADLTFFSPLEDAVLPETDFLYLPGGYPELHAQKLSENRSMLESIRAYSENGGTTYAECGGLMYLGKRMTNDANQTFDMVGLFPYQTTMQNRKLTLGYRRMHWKGREFRGHEFHYSKIQEDESLPSVATITSAKGAPVTTKLFQYQNTLATYAHIYWAEQPEFIMDWLEQSGRLTTSHV